MKNKTAFIKAFPVTIISSVIVFLILLIGFGLKDWALSFLLGSFTSLWAMSMLSKSGSKILQEEEKEAKKKAIINYAIRYSVYVIVLIVSELSDNLTILGCAAGLLTFKAILYILLFLEREGEKNNG